MPDTQQTRDLLSGLATNKRSEANALEMAVKIIDGVLQTELLALKTAQGLITQLEDEKTVLQTEKATLESEKAVLLEEKAVLEAEKLPK